MQHTAHGIQGGQTKNDERTNDERSLPLPGLLITEQAQGLPLAGSRLILQVFDYRKQRIPIRPHHKQSLKRLRVILNLAIDALGQEPGVVQEL